jgi:hypothetical protein
MSAEETITGPLSIGQWNALIHGTPDGLRPLVLTLAVFHGARERPTPAECPVCGKPATGPAGGQMPLGVERAEG